MELEIIVPCRWKERHHECVVLAITEYGSVMAILEGKSEKKKRVKMIKETSESNRVRSSFFEKKGNDDGKSSMT